MVLYILDMCQFVCVYLDQNTSVLYKTLPLQCLSFHKSQGTITKQTGYSKLGVYSRRGRSVQHVVLYMYMHVHVLKMFMKVRRYIYERL